MYSAKKYLILVWIMDGLKEYTLYFYNRKELHKNSYYNYNIK